MSSLLIAYIPLSMLALRALPWAKIASAKLIIYFLTGPKKISREERQERKNRKNLCRHAGLDPASASSTKLPPIDAKVKAVGYSTGKQVNFKE